MKYIRKKKLILMIVLIPLFFSACGKYGKTSDNTSDHRTDETKKNGVLRPIDKHPELIKLYKKFSNAISEENYLEAISCIDPKSRSIVCGKIYLSVDKLFRMKEIPGRSKEQINLTEGKQQFNKINTEHNVDPADKNLKKLKKKFKSLSADEKRELLNKFFSGTNLKEMFVDLVNLLSTMNFKPNLFNIGKNNYHVKKVEKPDSDAGIILLERDQQKKSIRLEKSGETWYIVYNM